MWTQPETKELPPEQLEHIQELVDDFYHHYAEEATISIVEFMDSIKAQLTAKKYLSDKQISAVKNIIANCAADIIYETEYAGTW